MPTSGTRSATVRSDELMSVPSPYPEFPTLPPGREPPPRMEPPRLPPMHLSDEIVRNSLAEQRRILVSGTLDRETTTALAAQLMAFDGSSSRDVEIVISSPGGPIPDFLPVLDVIDLMRAAVNVTAIGSVSGTAVGLVAIGTGERRGAPHAKFSLRLDATQSIQGTADDITRHAEELTQQRSRYLTALAAATGQDEAVVTEEATNGRGRSAEEALALGIIDTIASRS